MTELVSALVEKLASLAIKEIQLGWVIKDDLEKLKDKLKVIQAVLSDAEQKQTKERAVKLWLSKLKDICYDIDYVTEKFEERVWRQARSTDSTLKSKIRNLSLWMPNFILPFKVAHKMKELTKRLDDINKEGIDFKWALSSIPDNNPKVQRRETYSLVPSHVVGRNKEKKNVIDLLIRSGGAGKIEVVPILGMGGIGKTTLATMVYHDDKVNKHFQDNKVWISMPEEFDLRKIIADIVLFLDHEKKCNPLEGIVENKYANFEMLKDRLRRIVENKRCLFVMDDVLKVEKKHWTALMDLLAGVSKGSKVIVTSRDDSIAKILGIDHSVTLESLSTDQSLTLFVKCAFGDEGQAENHPDFMAIGKEIVSKCKGNPLAVKTLGFLLSSEKNNRSYWFNVRDSEMWLETEVLPSLRISYDLMPSYLKQCFAYCSIFPKSHVFSNLDLIQLWISNGLIQSSGNNQKSEEIGRQYLEELWSRSFFDSVHKDYPVQFFRMHDLIHELAISVAQPEFLNMKVVRNISSMTRHILFPNPSHVQKDELHSWLSKLRRAWSIMFEEGFTKELLLKMHISRFKQLRVLWLDDSRFDLLPSSIGGLNHLRFLTLRGNFYIKKLPKSICKLRRLQYLGLGGCMELRELPANIKNLINLRILSITTRQQRFGEGGIGCLTSLQWLFIGECMNLEALFDDIQLLKSLRKLFIWGCPKLASLPQGIKNLKALEDLGIWDCRSLKLPEGQSNEPCSMLSLQSFRLEGLPEIVSFPSWLEGSASILQIIRIADCPNLRVLPEGLKNCSSLRTLEIKNCPGLSSLPDGVPRIATLKEWQKICPSLSALEIKNCPGLSSLPDGVPHIATLKELQIVDCGESSRSTAVEEIENCE